MTGATQTLATQSRGTYTRVVFSNVVVSAHSCSIPIFAVTSVSITPNSLASAEALRLPPTLTDLVRLASTDTSCQSGESLGGFFTRRPVLRLGGSVPQLLIPPVWATGS